MAHGPGRRAAEHEQRIEAPAGEETLELLARLLPDDVLRHALARATDAVGHRARRDLDVPAERLQLDGDRLGEASVAVGAEAVDADEHGAAPVRGRGRD